MTARHARPRDPLLTILIPRGRHKAPSEAATRTGLALATAGLAGGVGAGLLTAASPAAAAGRHGATAEDFRRLAKCESGGNYAIATGNGYYGAYQFDRRTWQGLGYSGTANQHPPSTQDVAAWRLQQSRGWQPWPACSRKLGLTDKPELAGVNPFGDKASRGAPRTAAPSAPKTKAPARKPQLPVPANVPRPSFQTTLTTAMVSQSRADVRAWQARMAKRGWRISVDGHFGPQSESVARRFQALKGVGARPGQVDRATWDAAWTLPTR